jgi:hypothetical protein
MGILALTGQLVAGPPGSGLGNFPASSFQDSLLLGVAGSQGKPYTYSADSTSRSVNSPNAFQAIPGIGPGADVQRVDTLYFKCDAPLLLLMTFDDGTGRAVGPVGGGIAGIVAGTGGLAKVQTHAPHNLQPGDSVTLSGVQGTVEANGTWTIPSTDLDATHFDLPVSLANAYTLGGVVAFNAIQATKPLSGVYLDEFPESNVLLALAVKGSARVTFFACGLT